MKKSKLFIISVFVLIIFVLMGVKQKYDNMVKENKILQSENIDLKNKVSEAENYINLNTKNKTIIDKEIKNIEYNNYMTYEDLKIKMNEKCEIKGKILKIEKSSEFSKIIISIENNDLVLVVVKNDRLNDINKFDNIIVLGRTTGMVNYTSDIKYPSVLANEIIKEMNQIE